MAEGRGRTVRERDLVDAVAIASITGADAGTSRKADVDAGVDLKREGASVQFVAETGGEQAGSCSKRGLG